MLAEQRARSRGTVTSLPQAHGLIFTTRDRPAGAFVPRLVGGAGPAWCQHRSGLRHTLGLVFHDAA
ncbi:MAG TPA: 2OG-Fe(II) oxygenase [Kribbella sp.]|jgi:hypothetical protein